MERVMDAIEAIYTRRSIRAYTAQRPDRTVIETIIRDAAQAPPPFVGQVPWTFNVVEGVERIAALGQRAIDYARTLHRADEPGWGWLDRPGFKVFWDAPALIVISGPVEDCCRAGTILTLAAHARGLGTCWVGSPLLWLATPEARAELRLPAHLKPAAALCLGYPNGPAPEPVRAMPETVWV
jgi:nitroreductase